MVAAFVTQEGLSLLRFLSSILRSLQRVQGTAEDALPPSYCPVWFTLSNLSTHTQTMTWVCNFLSGGGNLRGGGGMSGRPAG